MRLIILLLLTIPFLGITQPKEFHFNKLSIKDGLPEDLITALCQDKRGYMWFGTQAGLVRYDGYKLKVYRFGLEDPNRCSVASIFEDRSGGLWIATVYEEIYKYNADADTFLPWYQHTAKSSQNLPGYNIGSVYDDRNGSIWFVASSLISDSSHIGRLDIKNHVLNRYDILGKGNYYINAFGFTNLTEDSKGRMWVGSTNGVYEYAPSTGAFIAHLATNEAVQQKKFTLKPDPQQPGVFWMNVWSLNPGPATGEGIWRYNTNDNSIKKYRRIAGDSTSLATDSVLRVQTDMHGRIWFTTFDGLITYDHATDHFINYYITDKKTQPYENMVRELTEDPEGNFWFFNQTSLSFFDIKTKTFTRYEVGKDNNDAVPYNSVINLFIDRSGTLWAGTAFQGVYWMNRNRSRFTVYKNEQGQPHYFPGGGITSFAQDKDGSYWVWAAHGLYHWYPTIDSFVAIPSMRDHGENFSWQFSAVAIDKKGVIWCNSSGKGIFSYNPQTKETRNFRNNPKDSTSISMDVVATLYVDKKGTLWAGTFGGGLCSFNDKTNTFRRYPFTSTNTNTANNPALNDAVIYCITEDKEGNLWLGTNFGGVNKFDPQTATFSPFQNQLPGFTTISSIIEDGKGRLWAGTHDGGLYLCDRKTNTAKRFTEKDGLIYDGSLGTVEDNDGNIWFASQRGFSILNNNTNTFSRLSTINGLPELPENNLNLLKGKDGRLLLPCNNGFISFYPQTFKTDTTVPSVIIESVEITNPRTWGAKQTDSVIYALTDNDIHLKYNENRISFNYVGIQYQNAALNQYAYRLDGYDKDWVQAGTERKVTYTNLSAGDYHFHVKAANSDGIWSDKEMVITIVISPPWWLTWWAYTLYVMALAAAVSAYIAYRSKRLKRENVILEEKVIDRTSQLNKSLEHLKATQTQLIQSEKMASLGELTAGIAHEIQNPLNFVNNFSDVNKELLSDMRGEIAKGNYTEVSNIAKDVEDNEDKINHHGKRADAIVKSMLQHSRGRSGTEESTNINTLADEYLRLAYHAFRRKDSSFNTTMKTDYDESVGNINIIPPDIGRVLLNLYNNAFYAVNEKSQIPIAIGTNEKYEPIVTVTTKAVKSPSGHLGVSISVIDNGNGIPQNSIDKIFQPFFTTKPTGQGTGLGLSLSYDIIKAHGGEIKVTSKTGEYTEFVVTIPG